MPDQPAQLPPGASLELAPGVYAPLAAVRQQAARASGPGGQNVNKVNTRMELWLDLSRLIGLRPSAIARLTQMAGRRLTQEGLLHLTCGEHRSQETNRQTLFARLQAMIQQARIEPKKRRKTRPGRAAKQRRLDSKKSRGDLKSQRQKLDY